MTIKTFLTTLSLATLVLANIPLATADQLTISEAMNQYYAEKDKANKARAADAGPNSQLECDQLRIKTRDRLVEQFKFQDLNRYYKDIVDRLGPEALSDLDIERNVTHPSERSLNDQELDQYRRAKKNFTLQAKAIMTSLGTTIAGQDFEHLEDIPANNAMGDAIRMRRTHDLEYDSFTMAHPSFFVSKQFAPGHAMLGQEQANILLAYLARADSGTMIFEVGHGNSPSDFTRTKLSKYVETKMSDLCQKQYPPSQELTYTMNSAYLTLDESKAAFYKKVQRMNAEQH